MNLERQRAVPMTRAKRSIDVNVSAMDIFKVITDYSSYPEFIPEMALVDLISEDGHDQKVAFELELFKLNIKYTLLMTHEPYRRISWSLMESNWMNKIDGAWIIESIGRKQVRITYEQEIKLKGFLPKSVSTKLIQFALPQMLSQFKQRAEAVCL